MVVDPDGIYDPGILNDRLLLGLKGTMSEFELNLLRQRCQEAIRQKARRGELQFALPVGYLFGVNYFFALTTIISPYQRQLPFNS